MTTNFEANQPFDCRRFRCFLFLFFLLTLVRPCLFAAAGESGEILPAALLIHGKTLYAAAPDAGTITAYDLTNPTAPKAAAVFHTDNSPCSLVVEGTRLYAVDTQELYVFDIADPGTLKLVSRKKISSDPLSGPVAVILREGDVCLARRVAGVFLNDEPAAKFYARCLAKSPGNRLFAAGPRTISSVETSSDVLSVPVLKGTPVSMMFHGSDLYIAMGFHGLTVLRDAADLCSVWEPGSIRKNTGAFRRAVWPRGGGFNWEEASLVSHESGPLGRFALSDTFVCGMVFTEQPAGYMLLAAGGSGVLTADLTAPAKIRFVAECAGLIGRFCLGITLKDRLAYVYERGRGLLVLDASDPLNVKLIENGPTAQEAGK